MSVLTNFVAFVVLVGGLVFFHELGHFLAAKYFNVKVLKFSLGFGPRVWGFRRGETEYQIAALPLGGFVRMAGEDPTQPLEEADRGRGFSEQAPWKRAVIAFAGPFVNLILPPLVFFALFVTPQKKPPPEVGVVLPGEPAAMAGLRPGDRIVRVEGVETPAFEDLIRTISRRPGVPTRLEIERGTERLALEITPARDVQKTPLGTRERGRIGVMLGKLPSIVGVDAGSRAEAAGIRTFDKIVAVNGRPVRDATELDAALAEAGDGAIAIEAVRSPPQQKPDVPPPEEKITATIPAGEGPTGLLPAGLFVRDVTPDTPVAAAGLQPGDRITSVNGTAVTSFMALARLIGDEKQLRLGIERAGKPMTISFTRREIEVDDKYQGPVKLLELGFDTDPRTRWTLPVPDDKLVTVSYPLIESLTRAVEESVEKTTDMLVAIQKLFSREISSRSVGGPIMMFQLAGVTVQSGLDVFLELFAIISINLGLVNLLPIPILDGFHIVVSAIETVSRRPVPMRFREIANYVGLALLLALFVLAMRNDIGRLLG